MRKKDAKLLGMALCASVLAITGCSKSNEDDTTQQTTEAEATTKEKQTTAKKEPETEEPTTAPDIYGTAGEISAYDTTKTNYTLNIDSAVKVHDISDMLFGIFIEDINFAADGGLYAEMVQNRSFEFTKLAAGDEKHAWSDVGTVDATVTKNDTANSLNVNNPNYMVLTNSGATPAGIANKGFLDGMAITENAKYKFSVYAKGLDGYTGPIQVSLMNGTEVAAEGTINAISSEWKKYDLTLTSKVTSNKNVKLQVTINKGKAAIDMVSLFPEDTYKGRENGLRKDLCEKLEALEPSFLRFPGGCVVEGTSLSTAYSWKNSIGTGPDGKPLSFNNTFGDVAARPLDQNIWTDENATQDNYPCYMTYGLGFYEYFVLAEDLGAVGVPVINCGMCCMIQGNGSGPNINSEEFQQYIQDALDLVEFCKGDANTTWGAVRVALGHPEPFELPYIGIGNEQWGDGFFNCYEAFVKAFDEAKKKNPALYDGVELMFSAGPDDGDSGDTYILAYKEAEKWLAANPGKTINDYAGAIDHHYYNEPEWFFEHANYYDEENYSRDTATMTEKIFGGGIQVFLGEYAAKSNTLKAALSEAAYMTGLERNGDIIRMAAYAPLFGNLTAMHWAPDLIWFNNTTSTGSINYYVQKIFGTNVGTSLLKADFSGAEIPEKPFEGKVGVGTWSTTAEFDNVKVVDNATGDVIAEDDFSEDNFKSNWNNVADGRWTVKDGILVQSNAVTNTGRYDSTGSVAYFGDTTDWTNYTFTVEATKTGGDEGFLIPFSVKSAKNNYFWNIGGWGNTVSCLQMVQNGGKTGQLAGTVKNCTLKTGTTYTLKVVVTDTNVKCYIDDELYVDYTIPDTANAEAYQVVSTDETGDIIIKMVNVTEYPKTFAIDIKGAATIGSTATVDVVAGNSLDNDNILGQKEVVTMESSEISGLTNQFNYTVPQYSVTVLRVKTK